MNNLICECRELNAAIIKTLSVFANLPKINAKYNINFSGGKDSHVLLGLYILYLQRGGQPLDVSISFADTGLEFAELYQLIEIVKQHLKPYGLNFRQVKGDKSFWFIQYAYGYPVPTHFNRWCTGKLKVQPLEKKLEGEKIKRIQITGRHFGESSKRDATLSKTCGSTECGIDLLKKTIDPLIHFSNCLIWDAIFFLDGVTLPVNSFEKLNNLYKIQESKEGSLRMGCFHCPVVGLKTLRKNVEDGVLDDEGFEIRLHLEELRTKRRVLNPRTKKAGSIYIVDRRESWAKLNLNYLLNKKYISLEDVLNIELCLKNDYSYPPTYSREWIDRQHQEIEQ